MPVPLLPAVEKVDPAEAWQPWQPDAKNPWTMKWAGHLYRRAAFGPTLPELRMAVAQGPQATIDSVLNGKPQAAERDRFLERIGAAIAKQNNATQLRAWWLYGMIHSLHPLREKMTLFWHNHFATSIAKVQSATMMFQQNRLLRRHALAKFRPFLLDIGKDPAMLVWLDSNSNVKEKPNENYARELMELFSLGVGHYSEKDIREASRAFTGWRTEDEKFEFDAAEHDGGEKTVFGKKGKWNGDDVVRIVLEQPAAAMFIVRKLYRYFMSEETKPPAALLDPLVQSFRKSDYDIGALVRTMLRSRHFFSEHAYRRRLKSPVEYVVGAARALLDGPIMPAALGGELEGMGQNLFAPPNVKGWAGGKAWLNTATVVARANFADKVAMRSLQPGEGVVPGALAKEVPDVSIGGSINQPQEIQPQPGQDATAFIQREKITDPPRVVELMVNLLLQGDIRPAARKKLIAFLSQGKPKGNDLLRRQREALHALISMPEYQLD